MNLTKEDIDNLRELIREYEWTLECLNCEYLNEGFKVVEPHPIVEKVKEMINGTHEK